MIIPIYVPPCNCLPIKKLYHIQDKLSRENIKKLAGLDFYAIIKNKPMRYYFKNNSVLFTNALFIGDKKWIFLGAMAYYKSTSFTNTGLYFIPV